MLRIMKSRSLLTLSSLTLALSLSAACSSSSEETPDAAPDGAAKPRAQKVNCTTAVTKQIETMDGPGRFVPNSLTITKGTIVKFITNGEHDAASRDNLFVIPNGETECVQFNEPGTYGIYCRPHSFMASIVVQ